MGFTECDVRISLPYRQQALLLRRVAKVLFDVEGAQLDRHHSFVVQYSAGKDLGLVSRLPSTPPCTANHALIVVAFEFVCSPHPCMRGQL